MIVFKNPGLMDVTGSLILGVSVKEGENPIGVFGTGLKYAIAILLRNGCTVSIWRGMKEFRFTLTAKKVRGKSFNIVTMNGKQLNFTDRMGLNWDVWQAYRELWSNTRDEGGIVASSDETFLVAKGAKPPYAPQPKYTTIEVTGHAIERAHNERHTIILHTTPTATLNHVEVHSGENDHIYYKSIRVAKLETKSKYTYNLLEAQALTEDRTLLYPSIIPVRLARAIVTATYMPFLNDVLNRDSTKGFLEDKLPYRQLKEITPSQQFMEAADALLKIKKLNDGAMGLFRHYQDTMPGYVSPFIVVLSSAQTEIVDKAVSLVLARVPSPGFAGVRIEFKSECIMKVTATKTIITIDVRELNKGAEHVAVRLLQGLVASKGGSAAEQFASLVLTGQFIPEELVKTPADYDAMPF